MPGNGVNAATVPGAISGYDAMLKRFGSVTFKEAFERAARIAEEGWGLAERRHADLRNSTKGLQADADSATTFLENGQAPELYSIIRNPGLAKALRLIQAQGRDAFYKGDIAKAIVAKVKAGGGVMELNDLAEFQSEWVEPITTNYHGYDVFQLPPPGQGFAALEMLNIAEVCAPKLGIKLTDLGPSDPMNWHLLVEAKKLAYSDLLAKNADPKFAKVPVAQMISKEYAATLCSKINPNMASKPGVAGGTEGGTIYMAAADRWGNMVSLVHSVFGVYGSRAVVPPYGFVLHNRGSAFSLDPKSPEHRGAAQAAVPLDHRRLRDEGWRAVDGLRQHGRQRAAGDARAAHREHGRPRDERADEHRRRPFHPQPEFERAVSRDRALQPGGGGAQRERTRSALGDRRLRRRLSGNPVHA